MPILHAIQAELGHVPADAVPVLAEELNLSRAEVHGVITFYHDFRAEPSAATTQVRVCRAEACQALGAEDLYRSAQTLCADRADLRQVFCLGNCALGPSVELNGKLYGRVDADRLTTLLGAS
jgi:formate dehydrogenase subunit gamma